MREVSEGKAKINQHPGEARGAGEVQGGRREGRDEFPGMDYGGHE